MDASAFQLPESFPAKLLEGQNFGTVAPDLIIAMNASLLKYEEWPSTLRFILESGRKVYVTENIEQNVNAIAHYASHIGGMVKEPALPNPFRQPIFEFKKDVNLPGWSNGFICVLEKLVEKF